MFSRLIEQPTKINPFRVSSEREQARVNEDISLQP